MGGRIISEVEERTFYKETTALFVLRASKIWHSDKTLSKVNRKIKIYMKNPNETLFYGDEIVVEGYLEEPSGMRNPGGFNQKAYLAREDIHEILFSAKDSKYKILRRNSGNPIKAKVIRIKKHLSDSLSKNFDSKTASFLRALFLGERSHFDNSMQDLFLNTGTLHILSVSGFHVGFVLAIVYFLLLFLKVSRNARFSLAILTVWSYCFLVGWQAPMIRASIMATLLIIGKLLGRKTDALNIIGCAGILILLFKPLSILDVGFQLSFLSVIGLVIFMPVFLQVPDLLPNERWTFKEKAFLYLQELFWGSFICLIVNLPITIQNFYIVSPSSLVANMFVLPVSFGIFILGFIYFLTFWWVPILAPALAAVIYFLMKTMASSLFFIENLPGSYWIVGKLNLFLWIVLTVGIACLLFSSRIKNKWSKAGVLLCFVTVILFIQFFTRTFNRHLEVTFLDVGQGDSIYFRFPNGRNLLIDAGKGGHENFPDKGRNVIKPFLKSEGINALDFLIISHPQEDHIGGMLALLNDFKIHAVVTANSQYDSYLYKRVLKAIQKEKVRIITVQAPMKIDEIKDVSIQVLNPLEWHKGENVNNESVVLKIESQNLSFLLTGDIQEEAMRSILEKKYELKSDFLKVPHHGARLLEAGREFVQKVEPKYSVISVGEKNPFHHPSPDTLSVLKAIPQNKILRTDQDGAIQVFADDKSFRVV